MSIYFDAIWTIKFLIYPLMLGLHIVHIFSTNWYPAIGELNADRSNFRFDFSLAEPEQYGECNFSVNFKQRRVKVKEDIRGVIARDYLYFHQRYNMQMSKQELKKYKA